jgi:hypothetical protein
MLNSTICGSVAFRIRSPNFSILRQDWKGSCSSEPLITMFGKSSCRQGSKVMLDHRRVVQGGTA